MNAFNDGEPILNQTKKPQNKRFIPFLSFIIIGLFISLYLELTLAVILILLIGATRLLDMSQRNKKNWQKWKNNKRVLTSGRSGIGLFTPTRFLPDNYDKQKRY